MKEVNPLLISKLFEAITTLLPAETPFVLVFTHTDEDIATVANVPPETARLLVENMSCDPTHTQMVNLGMDC